MNSGSLLGPIEGKVDVRITFDPQALVQLAFMIIVVLIISTLVIKIIR